MARWQVDRTASGSYVFTTPRTARSIQAAATRGAVMLPERMFLHEPTISITSVITAVLRRPCTTN
jgi:hypothetical protein